MARTAPTTLLCAALLVGPTIIGSTAAAAPAAPRSISFADAVRPASGPLVLPVVKGGLLNGLAEEASVRSTRRMMTHPSHQATRMPLRKMPT